MYHLPKILKTTLNLDKSVKTRKSMQALDAPSKIKKNLITNKVTATFLISLCTSIAYMSVPLTADTTTDPVPYIPPAPSVEETQSSTRAELLREKFALEKKIAEVEAKVKQEAYDKLSLADKKLWHEIEAYEKKIKEEKDQAIMKDKNLIYESIGTIDEINKAMALSTNLNTGWTGLAAAFVAGTDAYKLATHIKSIVAHFTSTKLRQIRDASKTGGGVGNASDADMTLLGKSITAVEQGLRAKNLLENLNKVKDSYRRAINRMKLKHIYYSAGEAEYELKLEILEDAQKAIDANMNAGNTDNIDKIKKELTTIHGIPLRAL